MKNIQKILQSFISCRSLYFVLSDPVNFSHVGPDQAVSAGGPGPANLTNIALQLLPSLLHLVGVVEVIVQNVLGQKLFITGVTDIAQVVVVLLDPKSSHLQQRRVDIFFMSFQIKFVFEICLTEVTVGSARSAV